MIRNEFELVGIVILRTFFRVDTKNEQYRDIVVCWLVATNVISIMSLIACFFSRKYINVRIREVSI